MIATYSAYRNRAILRFAKDQPCQSCGANDGTSVMAHSNLMEDGKGIGKKADDCFVSILCYQCHTNYDQRLNGFTQEDFNRAMKRTWKLLLMNGVVK